MKRWLVALALAWGLTAEGQALTGGLLGRGSSSSSAVPATCTTAGMVPIFLGSPLAMGCDAGLTYDAATDALTVTGSVNAGAFIGKSALRLRVLDEGTAVAFTVPTDTSGTLLTYDPGELGTVTLPFSATDGYQIWIVDAGGNGLRIKAPAGTAISSGSPCMNSTTPYASAVFVRTNNIFWFFASYGTWTGGACS